MAIEFHTGTQVDGGGNQAANMAALQNTLRDHIVAHAAWELVEEVTTAANQVQVFKCLAAVSGLAADFHVALLRALAVNGESLSLAVFETYDTATDTVGRFAPTIINSIRTPDPATGAFAGSTTLQALTNVNNVFLAPRGAAVDYWLVVRDDALALGLQVGATQTAGFAGAFDSRVDNSAVNDPLPLAVGKIEDTSTSATATNTWSSTRQPFPPAAGTTGLFTLWGPCASPDSATAPWATGQAFTTGDRLQAGKVTFQEIMVLHANGAVVSGTLRGKFKGMRRLMNPPSGVAFGDTVTFNGTKWVYAGNVSSRSTWVDTGVAP